MKKLRIVAILLVAMLILPSSLSAEPFEGGRDVVMLGAGVINVSLLAVIVYQAIKGKKPEPKAVTPQPEPVKPTEQLPLMPLPESQP